MNSNVNYRYKITYMTVKLLNISKDNKVSWTNLDANYALQQTFMIINHKDIIIRKAITVYSVQKKILKRK